MGGPPIDILEVINPLIKPAKTIGLFCCSTERLLLFPSKKKIETDIMETPVVSCSVLSGNFERANTPTGIPMKLASNIGTKYLPFIFSLIWDKIYTEVSKFKSVIAGTSACMGKKNVSKGIAIRAKPNPVIPLSKDAIRITIMVTIHFIFLSILPD